LERGDPRARELWQRAVDLTLRANQSSYDRLGVRFDHAYGESFYESMLAGVIEDALAKGVAHRDASGAVVGDLGGDLPTFLLQRSDGGTLYHTRDVATIKFRVETFRPEKILYVVGEPQTLHFRQLFALARALGYADGVELIHVAFGTVFDATGRPLSTRQGNMVYLQELLDEAHARALVVVERANPELPTGEKETIAEAVGIGAVIYNDLHQDPKRNLTLDWDRMLALEGNSAPYIQYMHARCRSILRRAVETRTEASPGRIEGDPSVLVHPSEQTLVKQLARLPLAIREAGARCAPSEVAGWCYETARALSGFYRDCRVLDAETAALRLARLRLVAATAQSLKNGLSLLAISAPDRL
jgi:arginyl-tRNA synthetase